VLGYYVQGQYDGTDPLIRVDAWACAGTGYSRVVSVREYVFVLRTLFSLDFAPTSCILFNFFMQYTNPR
jgi:hypothetical protein